MKSLRKRRISIRKYPVSAYQRRALQSLLPPEELTVSQWAEKYRKLDAKSSALPGPWRNEKTPYLVGIMDEFCTYETEETVFVKPSQVGGTEALLNMLGWAIQQDPAPAMCVYPSDLLAESIVANRFRPMVCASEELLRRYHAQESTKLELQFDGMYLNMAGSNSPSQLASKPIRFLFLDEVDKYPGASRREADPISLARERTKTFHNRKIYMTSTPTLRSGHIWRALESCDLVKHYFVPCPYCGKFIELRWKQLWFSKDSELDIAARAETAKYICQECDGVIEDRHKPQMLRLGKWRTVQRRTGHHRKVGFWLNTLYSPFVRFSEMAKEFLNSQDDPELLQNFVNSWLAEPWEDTKLKTSANLVLERQTDVPAWELPEWTKLLTGGIDVQRDCLYWTIRAWGDYMTSQNVAHGQALSMAEVERVMNTGFQLPSGETMMVELALMDSGDQTDEVYNFCISNYDWVRPCKGSSTPLQGHYRISTVDKAGSQADGMQLVLVDGGKYKDMIATRMRRPNGRGAWMVHKDCDLDYAEQVTAEHKITERTRGKVVQKWVPKTSHAANHYLDCEVYAAAAAEMQEVRSLFLQNQNGTAEKPPERTAQPSRQETEPEEEWIHQHDEWI